MSIIKSQNDVVSTQICLYNENKNSFIAKMGEEKQHERITELLDKLANPVVKLLANEESVNDDEDMEEDENVDVQADTEADAATVQDNFFFKFYNVMFHTQFNYFQRHIIIKKNI